MKKIFVLGDSISIHYGPYLEQYLNEIMQYDRKGSNEDPGDLNYASLCNGGDSHDVLNYINENVDTQYDILLLNCGLHDIKITNKKQIDEQQYANNLNSIVKAVKANGKKLIWVSTTPVDDWRHNGLCKEFSRFNDDVVKYNKIAVSVMHEHQIPIIDLYSFTKNLGNTVYEDHVHFLKPIRKLQAAFIAGAISLYENIR